MSFLLKRNEFKALYGKRVYNIAINVEKLHQKSMKIGQHIDFLKRCKEGGVVPRGMYLNNKTNIYQNNMLLHETMIKIRNNTLTWQYKQKRLIMIEIATQEKILKIYMLNTHPHRQHDIDLNWMNRHDRKKKELMKNKHDKKLNTLIQQQHELQERQTSTTKIDTSNVINKSTVNLTKIQLEVLAKGLKFVPTPKSINVIDMITNTERSLFSTPKHTKQLAISEITTFVQKWKKPKQDNMSFEERKALKDLKDIKNIIVVQADKGGKIVVMNKEEYVTKIEEKLNNTNLYEEVSDPTNTIKTKITELTTRLFKSNRITQRMKYELSSIDDIAKIRGQPKLHKDNHPMRIVTCARNTITSPISQFAFSFIKQLRETINNTVCNTSKFVEEIIQVKLEQDERFASLDVEDLFNNIPVTRAVDIAINLIRKSEKFCESNLTKTDLKQILLMSLNNSYFQFNEKFYRQKQGLPMGNTLSPILADLYMHDYMDRHMNDVNKPLKLWRYVDDILLITKLTEDDIKTYVNNLNRIKSRIRFTYEYEQHGRINFLDTTLSRSTNNKINVRWFRKETAADRLLNYNSCHHKSIKRNITKNMASRIIQTSKDIIEQQDDLEKLKKMLRKSNYPSHEVDKQINSILSAPPVNEKKQEKEDDKMKYCISLQYVQGIEVLKRKLEKLNIKVYFSYPNKIQTACSSSSTKPRSKSNIYQITCDCGTIYNGETKVGMKKRMLQHKKVIERDDESSNSEMVQHHHKTKHQCMFDPSKAFIIDNEIDRRKRRIKESIYSTINNAINRRDEIDNLWLPLLYERTTTIKNIIEMKRRTANALDSPYKVDEQDGDSGTEEENK